MVPPRAVSEANKRLLFTEYLKYIIKIEKNNIALSYLLITTQKAIKHKHD